MSGPVPTCGRPVPDRGDCNAQVKTYRQCPIPGCGHEIARCDAHGGDGRSIALMVDHIAAAHPPVKVTPPSPPATAG